MAVSCNLNFIRAPAGGEWENNRAGPARRPPSLSGWLTTTTHLVRLAAEGRARTEIPGDSAEGRRISPPSLSTHYGCLLCARHYIMPSTLSVFTATPEGGNMSSSLSGDEDLKTREVKPLAPGHTARNWKDHELFNPDLSESRQRNSA